MKYLTIILIILLSGCETAQPYWQQNLNNLNRQWRVADYTYVDPPTPVVYPGDNSITKSTCLIR